MNVPPYPMKIAPPDGTGEQWPPPCDVVAHCSYRAVVDVHNMVLCNKCSELIITQYIRTISVEHYTMIWY